MGFIHQFRKAYANITAHCYCFSIRLQNMMGQHGRGGFAIAASNTYQHSLGVTSRKFHLIYHRNTLLAQCQNQGYRVWNTRAFYHKICCQNSGFTVSVFLPRNLILYKNVFKGSVNCAMIRHQHTVPLLLPQKGGTNTTFPRT